MPTGREIMERAGVLLNDEEHVRWTLSELADWINEAVRATVLAMPSASTESRVLTLQAGTLQEVPQDGDRKALRLLDIPRNLKSSAEPRLGGRIVTRTNRATLDAQSPYWHDKSRTPYRKEVRHFVFDDLNPLEYYVYPGNDGTGTVEAVLSVLPVPLTASGDVDALGSWAGDIGLPEPFSVPLLDYVLYRAQSKDDDGASAGRAAAHYQQFATAVGLKIAVNRAHSPNAR